MDHLDKRDITSESRRSSSFHYATEFLFFQGGVTEEQMLKFMGAHTSLSPLQAKQLIEVSVVPCIYLQCPLFLFFVLFICFILSAFFKFSNLLFRMKRLVLHT